MKWLTRVAYAVVLSPLVLTLGWVAWQQPLLVLAILVFAGAMTVLMVKR